MPRFRQLFVTSAIGGVFGLALERMAFCLRKRAEREADTYFPSLSARTIVYKGMLTTAQLEPFFRTSPTAGTSPSWPWCTRGSPPTRSRPGRSPTPTG
jgi:glutamate synthase domain-containing protein 1